MTLREAIAYLLDDFQLDDCEEIVRADAEFDHGSIGQEHPKVQRFREAVAALRAELARHER